MKHRIQALRKEKGLSQAQLAEKAGVSEISIRKYESGERNPKIETLGKIAMALNVEISDLYDIAPLQPNDFKIPPGKIKVGPEGHEMFVDPIEFQRVLNGVVQKCCPNPVSILVDKFYHLNAKGQNEAIKHLTLLTKIPDYRNNNFHSTAKTVTDPDNAPDPEHKED